jgi:surfeit locus 1 family protein
VRFSFRPLRGLSIAVLLALALLLQLGKWQWSRYEEKLAAAHAGIKHVTLVSFDPVPDQIQLVYAIYNGQPAWRVFAPVKVDAAYTFVDAGVLPGVKPPDWRSVKAPFDYKAAVRGVPITPRGPSLFAAPPDKAKHLWYQVNLPAMVKAVGGKAGPPYYVAIPYIGANGALIDNPYALPNEGDTLPPERHWGYALTWWGLAAALVSVYIAYHIKAGRLSFRRPGA